MEVKLIDNEAGFWKLEEAWQELQSQGSIKNITMTWEWISTWWRVFRKDRDLAIIVAKHENQTVGIAPFIKRRIMYFKLLPYLRMELMASGENERDEICSDYLDFIIKRGWERKFIKAVFEYLYYSRDVTWNELLLSRIDTTSSTIPLVLELVESFGLKVDEIERFPCPYISLPLSFEEYLSQLGKSARYQIRHGMRKLNMAGEAVFKIARVKDEVESARKTLIHLHQSRWKLKEEHGVFSSDKFKLFHDRLIPIAFDKDWLRLGTLFLNGIPVACLYNFRFEDKICFYQSGMEVSELRHGLLAHAYAISHAISEGAKEYDFLAGASDYKRRLAKKQRQIITLRIAKPSSKEAIYTLMQKVKSHLRKLKYSFR